MKISRIALLVVASFALACPTFAKSKDQHGHSKKHRKHSTKHHSTHHKSNHATPTNPAQAPAAPATVAPAAPTLEKSNGATSDRPTI